MSTPRAETMMAACCVNCRHRQDDPQAVERRLPGLASFGSAYGASIAQSRLCGVHDCWVSPDDTCGRFSPLVD